MSLSSDLALLRLAPPFAALSDEQLRLVAFSGERVSVPAGGLLIEAGQPPPGAFVVLEGLIEVRAAGCRASQPAGPGAMVAQLALLAETDIVDEARATRPSEVMLVRRAVFRRLLEEYPEAASALHARLAADFLQLGAAVAGVRESLAEPPGSGEA
jgi:CRP-like cAMP-binding protein